MVEGAILYPEGGGEMKTLKLTERQRDALFSVIKPYAEGIATLKNSKGDNNCFKTHKGRLITAEEALKIMEMLEKEED